MDSLWHHSNTPFPLVAMLHDLLVALAGHPGDVITLDDSEEVGFSVAPSYTGVSTAERNVINSIVKIGYKYRCLEEFVKRTKDAEYAYATSNVLDPNQNGQDSNLISHGPSTTYSYGHSSAVDSSYHRGFYINSLCSGIDEYLEEYRSNLVTIEKVVLADPALPLNTLALLLSKQKENVDSLLHVITSYTELVRKALVESGTTTIRGDELLFMLHNAAGSINFKGVCKRLYDRCLQTFQMQLKSWICHGQLIDPHDEFLVGRRKLATDSPGSLLGLGRHKFVYEHLEDELSSEESAFEWNYMFYLRTKQPSWIQCSYKAWKDILFLGKAVRMLIRRYRNGKQLEYRASPIFDDWDSVLSSPNSFENAIANYRAWVARLFWSYINENLDVRQHFYLLRQIYMLGFHDSFTDFIGSCWFTMQTTCNLSAYHNVRPTFYKTVAQRVAKTQLESSSDVVHDTEMLCDEDSSVFHKLNSKTFKLNDLDVPDMHGDILSFFDFRQRSYHFTWHKSGLCLCGDAAWIDDEVVLNISEERLEAPISNCIGSASLWFQSMVHVTDGFNTSFKVELCQLEASYMYKEEKIRGMTLGRYCRFSVVLQSGVEPTRLNVAYMGENPWYVLKDCFSIEFVVDYDNLGKHDGTVFVSGYIILTGKCASAVRGDTRPSSNVMGNALCINMSQKSFKLTTGGRDDFMFFVKLRMTRKHIFAELVHYSTRDRLTLDTDAMDATQTIHHDFGDSYIGVLSTPYHVMDTSGKVDIVKRNCAIRISQWDFAGCISPHDILPLVEEGRQLQDESFKKELPGLTQVQFHCGVNEWIYSTLSYKSSWPMSILLNLPTLLCYNSIFQFMFLMRYVSLFHHDIPSGGVFMGLKSCVSFINV